jgi:hypothetical protein
MLQTFQAMIDDQGNVRLLEPAQLPAGRAALVTVLTGEPEPNMSELPYLSEPALAEDWNRPEEDEAWSHLRPGQSSSQLPTR